MYCSYLSCFVVVVARAVVVYSFHAQTNLCVFLAWQSERPTPLTKYLSHFFSSVLSRAVDPTEPRLILWRTTTVRLGLTLCSSHVLLPSLSRLTSPASTRANGNQAPTAARRVTRRGAIAGAPCTIARTILSRARGAKTSSTNSDVAVLSGNLQQQQRAFFPLRDMRLYVWQANTDHGGPPINNRLCNMYVEEPD